MGNYALRYFRGPSNVAIGYSAMYGSGGDNSAAQTGTSVAIGYEALKNVNNGASNNAVGYRSLLDVTTGNQNNALGRRALENTTSGGNNVGVGDLAGYTNTSGQNNTYIGVEAGSYSTGVTTGQRNTFVGNHTISAGNSANDQNVFGNNITGIANSFTFGTGGADTTCTNGNTVWSNPSDIRMKEDIVTATAGLSFINDLRPVTFKWKKQKDIPTTLSGYVKDSDKRYNAETTQHGFIAQEVKTAIDAHSELKDGFDMWKEDTLDGRQRVGETALIPMLVKAIQELSAKVTALEAA